MIIRNNTPSKISRSKFNKITYSFLVKGSYFSYLCNVFKEYKI